MAFRTFCLAALSVAVLTSCRTAASDDKSTAVEVLFGTPHRAADSLWKMPDIGPVEKPFTAALDALLAGDRATAAGHAKKAGYKIIDKAQDGKSYSILLEADESGVGPTVAVAATPDRDAVIQAPHPIKDSHTNRQAAVLFFKLGARALIIAGANRCAARDSSPCSGRTRICGGGRNPYRTSDPAHNPATLFHVAHRFFSRRWPRSIVVQPHGFDNSGSSVWFVISDGSREKRPDDRMLAGRVRDAIRESLNRRDRAVSCQDPKDRGVKTRWLCATTTVQGRDLNGSEDICKKPALKSSGRFLHIEQALHEVRRPFARDWRNLSRYPGSAAILTALGHELPCLKPACAPVQP